MKVDFLCSFSVTNIPFDNCDLSIYLSIYLSINRDMRHRLVAVYDKQGVRFNDE